MRAISGIAPLRGLTKQLTRFRQGLIEFGWIFASAASELRTATAFAADDRRDDLNDFAGLNLFREVRRDFSHHRSGAVGYGTEHGYAFEVGGEGFQNHLQEVAFGSAKVLHNGVG